MKTLNLFKGNVIESMALVYKHGVIVFKTMEMLIKSTTGGILVWYTQIRNIIWVFNSIVYWIIEGQSVEDLFSSAGIVKQNCCQHHTILLQILLKWYREHIDPGLENEQTNLHQEFR